MKIAIYLAANYGKDKTIIKETEKLGAWIGINKHTLVYGGSKTGLMLTLAKAVKENKGYIIGVEAKIFFEDNKGYDHCDEMYVEDSLLERKKRMMDIADCFIALPGGTGTLDEITEIMCLDKISNVHRPIFLLNINHFYDDLKNQLDKMVAYGYLSQSDRDLIKFPSDAEEVIKALK